MNEAIHAQTELIGARYALLDEIGRGAMGVVHRAFDRLSGGTVTVKLAHSQDELDAGSSLPNEVLVSLAHEFSLLASLRHPNVIRVFDYGFDPARGPYLVMEHRPDAGTLLPVTAGGSIAWKLDLLIELLRALAYLHRRGIVHRDLKPENVLVDGGHAKIVDFGLSILIGQPVDDLAGTVPYLAPEILQGGEPSARSDLWAIGIIACELLTGRHPFDGRNMLDKVLHRAPNLSGLDGPVAAVVERLLAKDARARLASAFEAAEALAASSPGRVSAETSQTRESFLQASRFVGRASELDQLTEALSPLTERRGSLWLLGGESGVGKSRLADEAAIRALIGGTRVLRGQAVADGGSPYEVWRPVLRGLALNAGLSSAEAAILRAIIPDIEALVGRSVGVEPPTDEAAAQMRLLLTIEALYAREQTPTLVILEDLQWAGSESMRLLAWLTRVLERAPVLILGTYRDDEAAGLPAMLDGARVLKLSRLPRASVEELARAIIGPSATDERLVDGLIAATEGNPFFLVETLRTIANEVGRLDALGAEHLKLEVPAEGVRRVLEQRLARPSQETREILRLAAVAGRRLDVELLEHAHGSAGVEAHLRAAADLAIVDIRGGSWEFAHDKLREALQQEIEPGARAHYHSRVALAIEAVFGEDPDQLTALAYHWETAANVAKSMRYSELAGARSLSGGAFSEAVSLFERARAHALGLTGPGRREVLFRIDAGLTDAHYQLGDLGSARRHGEQALAHVGDPIPERALGKLLVTAREAAARAWQTVYPPSAPLLPPPDLARYARVTIVLSECFMFAMEAQSFTISALRLTNRTAPAGPSAPLARGWLDLGMLAMTTPWKRTARRWVERATSMARQHGAENDHAFVSSRAGVLAITTASWDDADRFIHTAVESATNHGDRRLLDECAVLLAISRFFQARYVEADLAYTDALAAARRSGTRQVARWAALGRADIALRQGRLGEAIAGYDREIADSGMMATERVWAHGMRALARLRSGERAGARVDADATLALLDRSPPVAYWTQHGVHAAAEVHLALSSPGLPSAAAQRAVLHATILGNVAAIARPAAALLQAELLRRLRSPSAARRVLERARREGLTLGMSYEAALADLSLASLVPEGERSMLLQRAAGLLHTIGADGDARAAEAALYAQAPGLDRAR